MNMAKVKILNVVFFVVLMGIVSDAVNVTENFCDWSRPPGARHIHCKNDEFQCLNGKCITRRYYCDNGNDCQDNSDEQYCKSNDPCPADPLFIRCEGSLKCIPQEWICNGYEDCPSGEDEWNCTEHGNESKKNGKVWRFVQPDVLKWLRGQRRVGTTKRWGSQVDKSAVLLYFLDPKFSGSKENETVKEMTYELSIQLLKRLLRIKLENIPSDELASFVNAFTVMCLNPRSFHGVDLVQELRMRVDRDNYTNPYVFLTLCNAGETLTTTDKEKLIDIFWNKRRPFWTDIQALTVMALACASKQSTCGIKVDELKELTMELTSRQFRNGTVENLQTTALVMQALIAAKAVKDPFSFDAEKALAQILKGQLSNGSFGDLMNAYFVAPMLSCRSFIDINSDHCEPAEGNATLRNLIHGLRPKIRVQFSLWIGNDKDVERSVALRVPVDTSLYRLMEAASKLDSRYRFEYKVKDRKPYIYAIYGLRDDPVKEKYWFLYSIQDGQPVPSKESPADVIPKENEHYVLWYRQASWTK